LGQLIKKEVGNDNFNHGTEPIPLQVVDYRYNIRGWLTHINNTKGLQNTGDPDDLFSFAIHYTNTDQDYQNQVAPLYNGNIAETLWCSGSDNVERSYGYKYDALNRLTNAIYGKPGNSVKLTHNYNEWLTYDKNGNILTLDRNGISDSYWDLIKIDQLSYEYANNNSNLLVKVTDDTNNAAGFKKGNPTSDNDFTYDDNGNLITDKNKNITQIIYNHLHLPTKITFNGNANQYISYLYNATGQKIQKTIKNQDSLSTTHYINGFQYFDNVLQFFPTPEGYVKNTPTESGGYSFDYVYNYTDHLGNIRLSYTQDPQTGALAILEENHYYPFGLQHKNYNSDLTKIDRKEENNEKGLKEAAPPSVPLQNPGYAYKYNGKELQNEFGVEMYDFGSRNYDPALGRWMNIDPLAEKMRRHSPYNYAFNNPIYFIDPDGMMPMASMAPPDIYINEQGEYLGTDGAESKDVRVVSQDTWNSVGGQEGAQTAQGTATLQSAENSSLLTGTDKNTQPGYQKGISISDETKGKIENAGGKVGDPTLVNNSESSAFIQPEANVTQGPGATNSDGAYTPQEVKPGESVYGMVDGVKTSKFRDAVFKLVDGNKVNIGSGGNVSITTYGGLYSFGGAMTIGGWSTTEFPELRSVPIGSSNLNKSPTSLGGFKRFGEY